MAAITEHCVFCGKPIPEREHPLPRGVVQRYCSTNCAQRQQNAIKRLRETTPPEPER